MTPSDVTASGLNALLWFGAVVVLIPLVLWLLKRTPIGARGGTPGVLKTVAMLPLSPSQRVVTVEVGLGTEKRWLVLGVTAQQITTLHTMAAPPDAPSPPESAATFSHLLAQLRPPKDDHAR